jgi:hypothetical protein
MGSGQKTHTARFEIISAKTRMSKTHFTSHNNMAGKQGWPAAAYLLELLQSKGVQNHNHYHCLLVRIRWHL